MLLIYLSATGVFPTGRSDSEGTIKECSCCEQGLNSLYFLQDDGPPPTAHLQLSGEASELGAWSICGIGSLTDAPIYFIC